MFGSRKDLFAASHVPFRGSWISLFVLALLALSSSTSLTVRTRFTSGPRTRTAWAVYRPFSVSLGRDAGSGEREVALERPGGWCSRTATQGSTPLGSWEAVVVTCLHAPLLPSAAAEERESGRIENKELSR